MSTRILVVEDEILIGMDLVMTLGDWGYRPDGPHGSVEAAVEAIESFGPQIAILDMNLGGGKTSLPVAELLLKRKTPFVFLTGCNRLDTPGNPLADTAPRLKKPVCEAELKSVLLTLRDKTEAVD